MGDEPRRLSLALLISLDHFQINPTVRLAWRKLLEFLNVQITVYLIGAIHARRIIGQNAYRRFFNRIAYGDGHVSPTGSRLAKDQHLLMQYVGGAYSMDENGRRSGRLILFL